MPYHGEFAKHQGTKNVLKSSGIKDMLQVIQFVITDTEYERIDNFVIAEKQKLDTGKLKNIFVIDGSKLETPVFDKSEAKLCLFNINQCVIDTSKFQSYLKNPFPHPSEYKEIATDVNVTFFLPTKGMRTQQHTSEEDFFRSTLYKMFNNIQNPIIDWLGKNGEEIKYKESILETYLSLLDRTESIKNAPHPCLDCRRSGRAFSLKSFKKENGSWHSDISCKCENNPKVLYPTDLLGFHEQLNNENSNEALTTQIMLVVERILLLNLIHILIKNNKEDLIRESIFLADGALAVYSHAAWLSQAINKEIIELKQKYPLLILGIEKSGNFVDFFKKVDNHFSTEPLKPGLLFFLEDKYIREHIKVQDTSVFYGENNYFGKKLFYKNKKGKLFVMNVAFEDEADRVADLNNRNTDKYREKIQRLNDIIVLLDNFSSQSYDNALSIISLANDGAALSSNSLAKKLLGEFVNGLMRES